MGWRGFVLAGLFALAAAGSVRADVVEVTGWQVNFRERPSMKAVVIATLPRGERFELIARTGVWYHVRMPASGRTGYVHSSLVQVFSGALLETAPRRPVAPAPAAPPPAVVVLQPPPPPPPAPTPRPAPATPPPATKAYTPAPPPPVEPASYPPEDDPRRFDLGIQAGYHWLTQATESANAVFGDTGDLELGGFASFAVTRSVFLSLSASYFEKDGQRVFVVDATSPVFELGHPLKLRLVPVNLVVGYRFHVTPSVVPYLAAGGGATFYEEETTIGGITETSSSTHATVMVMGGVDYVNKNLLFGLQVSWSTVPDSLGVGGVSAIYGEDDVGGLSVSARLGLRF